MPLLSGSIIYTTGEAREIVESCLTVKCGLQRSKESDKEEVGEKLQNSNWVHKEN